MTTAIEIENDPKYVRILDYGFVGLVEHSGSDERICRSARVSYGEGTKSVRENRGLIRYLMRHQHTSPFEMGDVVLHLKIPIFVMRQLVRHRTSSLNEYSARYSVLSDEMYIPSLENIKPQSKANNQGRAGELSAFDATIAQQTIKDSTTASYAAYQELLGNAEYWSDEFPEEGIARELARTVMPVAGYTELYWKQNLLNLFKTLKLREDNHAQWEIQECARAIYKIVQPLFPSACEAYEDYMRDAVSLSSMERDLLRDVIKTSNENQLSFNGAYDKLVQEADGENKLIEDYRLSKRELIEFKQTLGR